jgi:hypothetical protein
MCRNINCTYILIIIEKVCVCDDLGSDGGYADADLITGERFGTRKLE